MMQAVSHVSDGRVTTNGASKSYGHHVSDEALELGGCDGVDHDPSRRRLYSDQRGRGSSEARQYPRMMNVPMKPKMMPRTSMVVNMSVRDMVFRLCQSGG